MPVRLGVVRAWSALVCTVSGKENSAQQPAHLYAWTCSDRFARLRCSPVFVAIQPGHEGAAREVLTQQPAVLGRLQACTCTADHEVSGPAGLSWDRLTLLQGLEAEWLHSF